jgi:regulator of sigma E protease
MPVIGVAPPDSLKLLPSMYSKYHTIPARFNSAAAAARVIPLEAGDVVVAATDPDDKTKVTDLPNEPAANAMELSRRMQQLGSAKMVLRIRRKAGAAPEDIEVPAKGFAFSDTIIGTTDPATPDHLFNVKELDKAPDYLPEEDHDPFDFRDRMRLLAGKPVVIQVKRDGFTNPLNLLVPPAYHWTVGLRMKMGKVAAVRDASPASGAIEPGDVISDVTMIYDRTPVILFKNGKKLEPNLPTLPLDPVRLTYQLENEVRKKAEAIRADMAAKGKKAAEVEQRVKESLSKWQVRLTVLRPPNDPNDKRAEVDKQVKLTWDDSWTSNSESPISPSSPTSIPQLGIAFWIESLIDEVTDDVLAKDLKSDDVQVIEKISFREAGVSVDSPEKWTKPTEMSSDRGHEKPFDQWAHYFWVLQRWDYHEVQVVVRRGNELLKEPVRLKAKEMKDWPLTDRGLLFQLSFKTQKADTIGQALMFGLDETIAKLKLNYLQLRSLLSGRISAKLLGGPIEIAAQAFSAADDIWSLIRFLGFLSIGLAVLNFLPIPLLDGGHMVFLIYEKLRGKPPSEAVRTFAAYLGLAILLSLIVFVFYLDIKRNFFGGL